MFQIFTVLKILAAAMENVDGATASTSTANENAESGAEFFNTGRVGRRNAMPDILGSHATTTTADLPEQLSALTTSEMSKTPSTSTNIPNESSSTVQIPSTSNS